MGIWWLLNRGNIFKLFFGFAMLGFFYSVRSDALRVVLPNKLQDTITFSLSIIYEALPFVILGILLSALVQNFLSQKTLLDKLPKNPFTRRLVLSFSGVFLPVCECGNVPLARGLMLRGLAPSDVMTFLFAAPIINPVTIITTVSAFSGFSVVLPRILFALLIANVVGYVFSSKKDQPKLVTKTFLHNCKIEATSHNKSSTKTTIKNIASIMRSELVTLLPALILGSLVAGVVQTFIPRDWLLTLSENPIWSILVMMLLAFIVSICASVDAFFALSLSGIFSSGAILSFLVFGPMIDIKMLSLMRTTFTKETLIKIVLLIATLSLLAGLVVDNVF